MNFTPLFGYNSENFPYVVLRANFLYVIDFKTFDVYKISETDLSMPRNPVSHSYANSVLSPGLDTIVVFGPASSSLNWEAKIYEFKLNADFAQKIKQAYSTN